MSVDRVYVCAQKNFCFEISKYFPANGEKSGSLTRSNSA